MSFDQQLQDAITLFQQQNYDAAEERFTTLATSYPDQGICQLYLAQLGILKGDGSNHIESLNTLLNLLPALSDGHHILGQCYLQSGKLPDAARSFYQALMAKWSGEQPINSVETKHRTPKPKAINFDSDMALQLLWQVLAQFYAAGIYAFPTAGTLLGLERSGALLPNDKDIDIGVDWIQMSQAIQLLESNGWVEFSRSYNLINPRCFRHSSGLIVDLCGYGTNEATGEAISGLWMKEVPFDWNRITYFPAISLLSKVSPAGPIYYLTSPESILESLYGPNWKQEDPYFDTIVCAYNLKGLSWLHRCYAYSRLYEHWRNSNIEPCKRILDALTTKLPQDIFLKKLANHISSINNPKISERKKRVLALGYFDLFHIGHLNYLRYAKSKGEQLIVGVAPDSFSLLSKGYGPIQTEIERKTLIENLAEVDDAQLVLARMDDTENAATWIKSLDIDTVVCGEEWQGSSRWQKLEAILNSMQITVLYAPKTQEISTTILKKRMHQNYYESMHTPKPGH